MFQSLSARAETEEDEASLGFYKLGGNKTRAELQRTMTESCRMIPANVGCLFLTRKISLLET